MAISLVQTNDAATCNAKVAYCSAYTANQKSPQCLLATSGGTAGSVENSFAYGAGTGQICFVFDSGALGLTSWQSGTYYAPIYISTANSNYTLQAIELCRVDASCANLATVGSVTGLGISCGATGAKAGSSAISGAAQSSTNSTDRLVVLYVFDIGGMGQQSLGITPNQIITTPLSAVVTPGIPPDLIRNDRYIRPLLGR